MKKFIKIIPVLFLCLCFGITVHAKEENARIIITAEDDNTNPSDLKYAINTDDEKAFSKNNIFEVKKGEGYVVYVKDLAGNITSKVVTVSEKGDVTVDKDKNNSNSGSNSGSSGNKNTGTTINVTPYDNKNNTVGSTAPGSASGTSTNLQGNTTGTAGGGTTIRNRIEGDGTLVESEVSGELTAPAGKEFYTIQTPDEHIFYLIIDHAQNSDNVYFLDAVTEKDLSSLIALGKPAEETEEKEKPAIFTEPEEAETELETEPVPEKKNRIGIIIIIMALTFGVAYYFKIYKPKQNRYEDALDLEEDFEPVPDQEDLEEHTGPEEDSAADEEGAERVE